MTLLQHISEDLARQTSRRGLFGRGAGIATGALLGAAPGTLTRAGPVSAGAVGTVCSFPAGGTPCPCDGCRSGGVCAKPCIIMTLYWPSGCWVTNNVTCCDCDCNGFQGYQVCGCGIDYHNNPKHCPQ